MIGRLKDLFRGRDGEWILSFSTPSDPRGLFDELHEDMVDVDIKKHRKGRSLDANAYCWVLIGMIAKKMNLPKNEVYRKAILDSGVYVIHCIPNDMLDRSIRDWESFGLGFQTETFPSQVPGCTNAVFYKGSSFYDTAQMSRLISGLIHEAEGLGIPTITPEEEKRMIGEWGKKEEKNGKQKAESKAEDSEVSA